jgi:hypothetical protein
MMFVRGRRMMLLLFCFFKKLALKAAVAIATMKNAHGWLQYHGRRNK